MFLRWNVKIRQRTNLPNLHRSWDRGWNADNGLKVHSSSFKISLGTPEPCVEMRLYKGRISKKMSSAAVFPLVWLIYLTENAQTPINNTSNQLKTELFSKQIKQFVQLTARSVLKYEEPFICKATASILEPDNALYFSSLQCITRGCSYIQHYDLYKKKICKNDIYCLWFYKALLYRLLLPYISCVPDKITNMASARGPSG